MSSVKKSRVEVPPLVLKRKLKWVGLVLTGECCERGAPVAGDQRLGRPLLPGRGELPSPICSEYVPRCPLSLPGKQRMSADGGDGRRVVPK